MVPFPAQSGLKINLEITAADEISERFYRRPGQHGTSESSV
jgi:hypothetical protein